MQEQSANTEMCKHWNKRRHLVNNKSRQLYMCVIWEIKDTIASLNLLINYLRT